MTKELTGHVSKCMCCLTKKRVDTTDFNVYVGDQYVPLELCKLCQKKPLTWITDKVIGNLNIEVRYVS